MKRISFLLFAVITFSTFAVHAEKLIVRLQPGENPFRLRMMGYEHVEVLIADMDLYAVDIPEQALKKFSAQTLTRQLNRSAGVMYAQENHAVSLRSAPNDKKFPQQWDMQGAGFGIDALNAWQTYGTGGFDVRGHEIVVAVVDSGVDVTHEDLAANMWVNRGEIPGNNIDDDKNGYVDDVYGWNAFNDKGTIPSERHGTHVSGIIGAVGNNGIHGAGINWNVKIMSVAGASRDTATVMKAYGYIMAQKKLWLKSKGLAGANVVVNNSSFGIDYASCKMKMYFAWNDAFNEMGKLGILTAAATANQDIDIDRAYDIPTSCESPYLVTVTSSDKTGQKSADSAWGATMIDLAAPGEDIFSTVPKNSWGLESGTSMAAPHVAGAIAYLHSAGSFKFNDLYVADPGAASLALKDILLGSVTPMADLQSKTVSGGSLNLNTAAASISKF